MHGKNRGLMAFRSVVLAGEQAGGMSILTQPQQYQVKHFNRFYC